MFGLLPPLPEGHGSGLILGRRLTQPFMLMTWLFSVSRDYIPGAQCPLFLETLLRPALSADDFDLLQRWSGWALIGDNISQVIMVMEGPGGTGKGTFTEVLTGILGPDNIGSLRTKLLGEHFETGRALGKTLLYGADVFDVFRGKNVPPGQKSMAYAFTYRHSERTLTDADVNAAHEKLVAQLKQRLQAVVRES